MSRRGELLTWLIVLATAGTGLVQAWMRYLVEPVDEFSAYNHPWQGTTEALHALLGPLLALGLGMVLAAHARPKWFAGSTPKKARLSGALVASLVLVLVVSGAWLNAWPPVDEQLLNWIHGIAGATFTLAFLGHALRLSRRAGASRR